MAGSQTSSKKHGWFSSHPDLFSIEEACTKSCNLGPAQSTRLSYGLVLDLNHFRTAYYYDEFTKTAPTTIFAFKEQAFFSGGRKTIVIGAVLGAENDGWQYFFGLAE